MIEENRKRVAIQSELNAKGPELDTFYRDHLHGLVKSKHINISEEMANFQLEQETVKLQEDALIEQMILDYEQQLQQENADMSEFNMLRESGQLQDYYR